MMMQTRTLMLITAISLWGCSGDEASNGPGLASTNLDSGAADAGAVDAANTDAGPEDSGKSDTGLADAGQPPNDAGQPPSDAGQPPNDAGQPPKDVGPGAPDTDSPADTGDDDGGPQPECATDDDCADKIQPAQCLAAICNSDGSCVAGLAPKGTDCEDGDKCTGDDTCDTGKCVSGKNVCGCSSDADCDDKEVCTIDKCEANGDCTSKFDATANCSDGDVCTEPTACDKDLTKCDAGAAKTCDDSNECTDDSCTKDKGCVHLANQVSCTDANPCNTGGVCKDKTCAGTGVKTCDDNDPCTDDQCEPSKGCVTTNNTAKCSDTKQCKAGDCKDGNCNLGNDKGCDDNNACTTDKCVDGQGCVFDNVGDGTDCDDGSKCTSKDECQTGVCTGPPTDCNDANACTTDSCKPDTGCSWAANTAKCEDGNKCTTGEVCAGGKCSAGKPIDPKVDCSDGNPCTLDGCDPDIGCTHPITTGACDDGDKCSTGDACKDGKCEGGTGSACPDGGQCKVAICDKKTGACSWSAKDGKCDDGSLCTTGEVCTAGNCKPEKSVDCDDKQACTTDACNPKDGKCVNTANSDPCDDNSTCTENDACVLGKCVGANKDCSDGDPCTADACDAKTGKCTNSAIAGCGGCKDDKACDDGNPCTNNSCDTKTGKCSTANNTAPCDNKDPCTYGDKCDGAGKCKTGTANACDDDNTCTTDACDKANGKCVHTNATDGSACNDGKACTTGDVCKVGKCTPAKDDCDLYFNSFDCGSSTQGWALQTGNGGNSVGWRFDNLPANERPGGGCSLNYNDATDYCQPGGFGGNSCQTPGHHALTPTLDASNATGTPRISFWTWYQLDSPGSTQTDRPRIRIYAGNQTIHDFYLDKAATAMNHWRFVSVAVPNIKGRNNVRVRFYLSPASGQGGNSGKGWFIDDLRITKSGNQIPEVCGDGVDNDGDLKIDCADADCKSEAACIEQCTDGKDNDLDDQVDCKDADCATAPNCVCLVADCDDKQVCSDDSCDAKTGKCVHTPNSAQCSDDDECTSQDTCGGGNCVGTPKACSDGDPCTADSCDAKTGKCANAAIAGCGGCKTSVECDDGNACTTDVCDTKTGKCASTNNTSPCDTGDLCSYGDVCDGKGTCVTGKAQACDDGATCTTDKCDAKTGKCTFTPVADATKCTDGKECTTGDACKEGACTPTAANCPVYSETFDCPFNAGAAGYTLQGSNGNNSVRWRVDDVPKIAGATGCTLNYNDTADYCQPFFGNNCQNPDHSAYTGVIDLSKVQGTPKLTFRTYYDLDGAGNNNTDRPRVRVYAANGNQLTELHNFVLGKATADMKKWRDISLDIPQAKGRSNIRVRFYLSPSSGQNGNQGQGWFIDDLKIMDPGAIAKSPELCDDGKDNDFDGQTDCLDLECKGHTACLEDCGDGKDNDLDDKIDCADPDCSAVAACQPPMFSASMECGDTGFSYSAAKNGVTWAIDGLPAAVKPVTGGCTLNFNNGKDFCGHPTCAGEDNRTAGDATISKEIDATGLKTLQLEYWSYLGVQSPEGVGAFLDVAMAQASTDDFKGCCNGATTTCQWSQVNCSTATTKTYLVEKTAETWKKWVKVTVDLKDFVGKKFKLRLRFSSQGTADNDGPGWFVDDLKLFGGK